MRRPSPTAAAVSSSRAPFPPEPEPMAKTTFLSDALLNAVLRNTTYTSPVTVYAGLISAVTDLEAGTVTEAAYTGYARAAAAFGAPAANSGARRCQNSGLLSFGK